MPTGYYVMTSKDWLDLLSTVNAANTILSGVVIASVVSTVRWLRARIEAEIKTRDTIEDFEARLTRLESRECAAHALRIDRVETRLQAHLDDERERRVTAALGEITERHRL